MHGAIQVLILCGWCSFVSGWKTRSQSFPTEDSRADRNPSGMYKFTVFDTAPRASLINLLSREFCLKPMHNIGKVSVNASILYKNQEIVNKTNLWKFQLISLFLLRENSKNAFSIFVFILMARVFVSYFTNYSKTITHRAEIFQRKLSTIVIFIPCKLCVNLYTFLFFGLTDVVRGI